MVRPDIPRLAQAEIASKGRRLIRIRRPRQQQDAFVFAILAHRRDAESIFLA